MPGLNRRPSQQVVSAWYYNSSFPSLVMVADHRGKSWKHLMFCGRLYPACWLNRCSNAVLYWIQWYGREGCCLPSDVSQSSRDLPWFCWEKMLNSNSRGKAYSHLLGYLSNLTESLPLPPSAMDKISIKSIGIIPTLWILAGCSGKSNFMKKTPLCWSALKSAIYCLWANNQRTASVNWIHQYFLSYNSIITANYIKSR